MNWGSPFLREISRITSSSRPGGTVSDSMSVTKPWRYFCATSASRSCCCVDMPFTSESARAAHGHRADHRGELWTPDGDGFLASQLGERQLVERTAEGGVDALPSRARAAYRLEVAGTVVAAALRDGDRSLDRVDDLRCADAGGRAGELVAAVRAARRGDDAGPVEALQQLAHRGQAEARALGHRRGRVPLVGAGRQAGEHHGAVVGELADP